MTDRQIVDTVWESEQRDDSHLGWDGAGCVRLHRDTQNGVQLKTYKLFVYGIFHLKIFGLQLTMYG